MTEVEKGCFLKLLNRGGYVLDFTTPDFNAFTMDSIGVALCSKYGVSKGQSLSKYLQEGKEQDVQKLLFDFILHYEQEYPHFHDETGYGRDDEEDILGFIDSKEPKYKKQYEKCKAIVEKYSNGLYANTAAQSIKEAFSSEYINKQVDIMMKMRKEYPTDAIGKAKELIESCCKAILENNNIAIDKDWTIIQLAKNAMDVLKILPKHIPDTDPVANSIKAMLGLLSQIPHRIAELRNPYGSGHGKSPQFIGLEERHAKLAVGATETFVEYLWDSFLNQQKGTKTT